MSSSDYRTVIGIVQWEPKDGEAAGKPVRNIVVNSVGFKEQAVSVYATLWPSQADVEVAENDVVILEGRYNRNVSGEKTYHNLSVARIAVLGKASEGVKADVDDNDASDADPDEIPF